MRFDRTRWIVYVVLMPSFYHTTTKNHEQIVPAAYGVLGNVIPLWMGEKTSVIRCIDELSYPQGTYLGIRQFSKRRLMIHPLLNDILFISRFFFKTIRTFIQAVESNNPKGICQKILDLSVPYTMEI